MQRYCHTCGGELPDARGESPFCPHCGAPQLTLSLDLQTPDADGPAGETSPGAPAAQRPEQVDWQMAIRCASAVAAVGGLLCVGALRVPMLTPASALWILCGSMITLGLYQHRRPLAWMDARVGARIGVVVGLCMTVALAIPMATAGVVARFWLKTMGGFDAQMAAQFQQVMQRSVQQSGTPYPAQTLAMLQSPEFRAASVLFSCAFSVVVLLVVSAVGGAFSGLMRTRHQAAV